MSLQQVIADQYLGPIRCEHKNEKPNKWGLCDFCYSHSFLMGDEPIYTPTSKQLEYHSRTEPNVLFWGGRGSGKSVAIRWDAHTRAMAHPGFNYCILRRTYPELQRSHLIHVPGEMKKLGGTFHHTDRVANYPNGSKGFFSHCANDEDVLNLLSAEFALMIFDEISTFEWEMFTKLAASVRVPRDSNLIAMVRGATNPLGVSAEEINRYFVLKDITLDEDPDYNPNDWFSIKANLDSNPYLDQDQYRKRFSGLPSHVRKAWVEGEFGMENAIFDFYPTKDNKPYHVVNDLDIPSLVKNAQIYRAFDMGYFPDPAYCAWIAHLGDRYIVFHEKTWIKTIVSDIAKDILEEDEKLGITKVVITYCDPTIDIKTGADVRTMKDTFELYGVSMETSINNREHFAAAIQMGLSEEVTLDGENFLPRLQIYLDKNGRRGCPYLVKTLPRQRFDPKHPLRLADHPDDHAAVTVAYFMISSGAMEHKKLFTPSRVKRWLQPKGEDRWVLGTESAKKTRKDN